MAFERKSATPKAEVKRMWPGGPLRQFSPTRFSGSIPMDGGGHVGSYVCDVCGNVVAGVYEYPGGWRCAGCRNAPAKSEPEGELAAA
jgi:hypothetical protein